MWKTLSSKYVYKSKWMKIRHDKTICPDGNPGSYDIVEKDNFVLIIPKVTNRYYMIEQYRYPIKKRSIEFPQGHIEKGEKILTTVKRELMEETGLVSDQFTRLGFLWLAAGHNTQGYYVYLADNCKLASSEKPTGTESDMVTKVFSPEELKKKILEGKIKDSHSIAAYYLLNKAL